MSKKEKVLYPVSFPVPDGYADFNEDWCIGKNGDMIDKRTGYHIPGDELDRNDWLLHLSEKRWFDVITFLPTYHYACMCKGLGTMTLRFEY